MFMGNKDVQDYLDKGMYGAPQIKPDEKRKYLGTFRERIYLSMTLAEMSNTRNLAYFKEELTNNPNHQVLINAAVASHLQNTYMVASQKAKCPFKIVDTENQQQPDAIGLVYAGEEAVDIDPISVTEKYANLAPTPKPEPPILATDSAKKKSWLSKLFK